MQNYVINYKKFKVKIEMPSLNILILENEITTYNRLLKILKKIGFKNIYKAKNSKDALKIASKIKLDLLLSDTKIDGHLDGIDTVSVIQNVYSVHSIFISKTYDVSILKRVAKTDFFGYILNPFRTNEFEIMINLFAEKYILANKKENIVVSGAYSFDINTNKFFKSNDELFLTKKESLFIKLLFNNKNRVVLYDTLDKILWNGEFVSSTSRRTFIYRVKKKLDGINIDVEKSVGVKLC